MIDCISIVFSFSSRSSSSGVANLSTCFDVESMHILFHFSNLRNVKSSSIFDGKFKNERVVTLWHFKIWMNIFNIIDFKLRSWDQFKIITAIFGCKIENLIPFVDFLHRCPFVIFEFSDDFGRFWLFIEFAIF